MPRTKGKKKFELKEGDRDGQTSPASSAGEDDDMLTNEREQASSASLDLRTEGI